MGGGDEEVRGEEDRPGAKASATVFVATTSAVTLFGEPIGQWNLVTHMTRPPAEGGDRLDSVLNTDLRATAAPDRAWAHGRGGGYAIPHYIDFSFCCK